MEGKGENGGGGRLVLASGCGLLIPLHFRYKCIQALFINKYSTCLHMPPPAHLPSPQQTITWNCQSHLGLKPLDRPSLGTKC